MNLKKNWTAKGFNKEKDNEAIKKLAWYNEFMNHKSGKRDVHETN